MPRTKRTEKKNKKNHAIKQVIDIIKFMGENSLSEIDLETSELKMSLKKYSQVQMITAQNLVSPAMQIQQPNLTEVTQEKSAAVEAEKKADSEENYKQIVSPMSGTFYRSPSPSSPPFIDEGSNVTSGETVCIVEAMKMMNEIKSDFDGKVVKILIENGDPVEKGEILLCVK